MTIPAQSNTPASTQPSSTAARPPGPARIPPRIAARLLVTQALLAGVVGVAFLLCYAGLQRDPQPHDLPVAVVGDPLASRTAAALGDRVHVTSAPDDAAARRSIEHRTQVAALSPTGPRTANLYIAGANGLAENGAAQQLVGVVAASAGLQLSVVDLAPTQHLDPRGLASFYVALATTVGAFIVAQALFALRSFVGLRAQLIILSGFALGSGALIAALARSVLDVVPVPLVRLAPVLMLLSLAVACTSRALTAWLGSVGITVATLVMTAVGLSTSGGILSADLLPPVLGALGSVLPPGAALRALVTLGYFHDADATQPLLILVGWAVASLAALLLHDRLRTPYPQRSDLGG